MRAQPASGANVVLVGMRASGKTTLGRELARRLERPFVDLDEELGRRAGASADAVLAQWGEARFRELERHVLAWAAGLRGHVLATGGGAVTQASAFAPLAASATVVYLELPVDELVERALRRPRPRLTSLVPEEEVRSLFARRQPLYRSVADVVIPVGTAVSGGADPILALVELLSARHSG